MSACCASARVSHRWSSPAGLELVVKLSCVRVELVVVAVIVGLVVGCRRSWRRSRSRRGVVVWIHRCRSRRRRGVVAVVKRSYACSVLFDDLWPQGQTIGT
jgi:hypothetical protein